MIHGVLPAVSADVQAFAEEKGIAAYVPSVLALTQRVFPNARRVEAVLDIDPEIANEVAIRFDVFAPISSVPEWLALNRQWNLGVQGLCPGPLLCLFVLSTRQEG